MKLKDYKSYFELLTETLELLESPQRAGPNIDAIFTRTHSFEIAKKAMQDYSVVDKIKINDIIFKIHRNESKHNYVDVWLCDQFTSLFIVYNKTKEGYINVTTIWQRPEIFGLARKAMLEYYIHNFNGILSDLVHTTEGEKYWKKLILEAINLNFNVKVIHNGDVEIFNMNKWEEYYKPNNSIQFLITK